MSIIGWFYMHENGELIYKREIDGDTASDIRDSDFARGMWPVDPQDRATGWTLLIEGLAAGANHARVQELADRAGFNNEDAQEYAKRVGAKLTMDGDQWCATRQDFVDLQASPAGFGPTALEALASLAKALGYQIGRASCRERV